MAAASGSMQSLPPALRAEVRSPGLCSLWRVECRSAIPGRFPARRTAYHPTEPLPSRLANDRNGASGRVPAVEAECPLSLQLGDLRADAGQRARSADSGRSPDDGQPSQVDPLRTFICVDSNVGPCPLTCPSLG